MIDRRLTNLLDIHLLSVGSSFCPYYILPAEEWSIAAGRLNEEINNVNQVLNKINLHLPTRFERIKPVEYRKFVFPKDAINHCKVKATKKSLFFKVSQYNPGDMQDISPQELESKFFRIAAMSYSRKSQDDNLMLDNLYPRDKKTIVEIVTKNKMNIKVVKYGIEIYKNNFPTIASFKSIGYYHESRIARSFQLLVESWELNQGTKVFS